MPGVRKVKLFSVISAGAVDSFPMDKSSEYCPSCLEAGIRSELHRRIYRVPISGSAQEGKGEGEEGKRLEPDPQLGPDADKFRQCYRCGDIIPIYNIKHESKIEDFVVTLDNPFDYVPSKTEGLKQIPNPLTKSKSRSKYKRRKDYISSIKDEDIRKELEKGNTLINYFE